MKLKFLGVRGSRPCHKRTLLGHGGNSTAMEFVTDENFYLFLDGGSGLAHRGMELTDRPDRAKIHILVTHTHWDHILGFPFFEPLYGKQNEVTFYASNTSSATFHKLFFGLQSSIHLPVPETEFKAKLNFRTVLPGNSFKIGSRIKVEPFQLNHQGVTLAYKVVSGRDSVVVITDNAPALPGNMLGEGMENGSGPGTEEAIRKFEDSLVRFLRGTHTVVFDSHFTEKNLKPDWGHSTPERALKFCKTAGVKRLILFHHAPEDTDVQVDMKVQSIFTEALRCGLEVVAAREGDQWELRSA